MTAYISPLIEYGVLGLGVLAFIFGWVVPGFVYKRAIDRLEELEDQFANEVVPALTRAADALRAVASAEMWKDDR